MSTDVDWQHELDTSFGSGHDLPPAHYVAAGRTAVRRRRMAALVAAAAVVVAGGAAWAITPDTAPRSDAPVATRGADPQPDPPGVERRTDRTKQAVTPSMSVEEEFGNNPAIIEPNGAVKLSPLTDVELQRRPNPMGYTAAQGRSVALRVIYQGVEKYVLIATTADGTGSSTHLNDATGDFPGWVADKVRLQQGLDVANGDAGAPGSADTGASADPSSWLRLDPDGQVEAAGNGIEILEARVGVDLGDAFARPGDRTGAVRLLVGGRPEHVAYRVVDGRLEVIDGPGSFDSLDAFIAWARQQYASGTGLR
jgi:hypothetical protein